MEVLQARTTDSFATTATSSPLSEPPSSDNALRPTGNSLTPRSYRSVNELPFELAQHVQTYYEETLFTQAFDFLISLVSNSISSRDASAPILLPGPPHLALAATVSLHPGFTTRTREREKWNQANAAVRLLRLILSTAGPVKANVCDAFRFIKYYGRNARVSGYGGYSEDEDSADAAFKTRYATTDSIFTRVDDFWSLIGWAFNCSCLPDAHAARWVHYEIFLTFMLDLLETDWQIHVAANTTEESLIWQYIELASGGFGRARRIIRGIFADGSAKSLNEFREVFKNELKPPKDEALKYKSRTVNVDIDENEFGDYLAPNDSDASENDIATPEFRTSKRKRTPSRRTTPRTSNESLRSAFEDDATSSSPSTNLGPPSALRLRIRLLHLLSDISSHESLLSTSPTTFPDLDDLYTLFVEFIKPLPLPIFQQILSPSTVADVLSMDAASTLGEMVLMRILESDAPSQRDESYLTIGKLCKCYLPFAAGRKGTITDQARVGIVCEALLRRCKMAGMLDNVLDYTSTNSDDDVGEEEGVSIQELYETVEAGIERREDKGREYITRKREARKGKSSSKDKDDEEAYRWLKGSGDRMKMILKTLS